MQLDADDRPYIINTTRHLCQHRAFGVCERCAGARGTEKVRFFQERRRVLNKSDKGRARTMRRRLSGELGRAIRRKAQER